MNDHKNECPVTASRILREAGFAGFADEIERAAAKRGGDVGVGEHAVFNDLYRERALNFEREAASRVIGQPVAVSTFARAAIRAEHGIVFPRKPKNTLLFLGFTGTGKTELAKAAAELIYGDERRMARVNLNEFMTPDTFGKLVGSNSSEQGVLGDEIDRVNSLPGTPGGVLLVDEVDKGHDVIRKFFMTALDEGYFTTASGKVKWLRNFYIVATSNFGAADAAAMQSSNLVTIERVMLNTAERAMGPELFVRLKNRIIFHKLNRDHQVKIARLHLDGFIRHMRAGLALGEVRYDDAVVDFLVKEGYSKNLGARPMVAAIESHVGDALVAWLLAHPFANRAAGVRVKTVGEPSMSLEILSA